MAKRGSVKWSALAAPFEVDRNKTKRVVNLQEVLEQVFYDPWRPRDDRLGPLVLQAKQRSKGYVSIEAIRGQLPQFTAAQIRTAAMASRQLRLSSDQASVRRVFGSRDDILQYLDHIFGKKKYFGSWLHKHEDEGGWVLVKEVAAFPHMRKHRISEAQIIDVAALSSEVVLSPDQRKLRRAPLLALNVVRDMVENKFASSPGVTSLSLAALARDQALRGTFITPSDVEASLVLSTFLQVRGDMVHRVEPGEAAAARRAWLPAPGGGGTLLPTPNSSSLLGNGMVGGAPGASNGTFIGAGVPGAWGGSGWVGGGGAAGAAATAFPWQPGFAGAAPAVPVRFDVDGGGPSDHHAGTGAGIGAGAGAPVSSLLQTPPPGHSSGPLLGSPPGLAATPLKVPMPAPGRVPPLLPAPSHHVPLDKKSKYYSVIQELAGAWGERRTVWASGGGVGAPRFSVLSWNILAEYMAVRARSTMRLTGPWSQRMNVIVARILALRPNIVCLQEVQVRSHDAADGRGGDNHAAQLLAALAPFGYEGHYATGERSATALLMWDRAFRLQTPVVDVADMAPDMLMRPDTHQALAAALSLYSNRVILAQLVHCDTSRTVLACCGHANVPLNRSKDYSHYLPLSDCVVTALTLEYVRRATTPFTPAAVVWGVDLNSHKDDPAVHYVLDGRLSSDTEAKVAAQADRDLCRSFPSSVGRHQLTLSSAYRDVLGHTPAYTNANPETGFVGSIDYVFYSSDTLRAVSALDVYPWSRTLHPGVPQLPNRAIPSDHLPLFATFEFSATGGRGASSAATAGTASSAAVRSFHPPPRAPTMPRTPAAHGSRSAHGAGAKSGTGPGAKGNGGMRAGTQTLTATPVQLGLHAHASSSSHGAAAQADAPGVDGTAPGTRASGGGTGAGAIASVRTRLNMSADTQR